LGSSLPSSCGCFGCVILPIFLIRSICCKCDGLQNVLLSQFELQQLCGSGYYRGSFAENLCWLCKRYHQLSAICCCNWSGYDYNLVVDSTISNQSPEWLCAVGLWLWEECPASLTSSQLCGGAGFLLGFDRRWTEDYCKRLFGVCTRASTWHWKGHHSQEPGLFSKLSTISFTELPPFISLNIRSHNASWTVNCIDIHMVFSCVPYFIHICSVDAHLQTLK
jgi:hypothetical protein